MRRSRGWGRLDRFKEISSKVGTATMVIGRPWHHGEVSRTQLIDGILPVGMQRHLDRTEVGTWNVADLADRYGTPLYVYDASTIRETTTRVIEAFAPLCARVSFASKSCSTIAVLQLFERAGLGVDVVSSGELRAALQAGFSPDRIHLHGNAKSDAELEEAIHLGLHAIVVDNLDEIQRIEAISRHSRTQVRVMVRLALPLEADTHPHLRTSGSSSKFGFSTGCDDEQQAIRQIRSSDSLSFVGLHAHLGSQLAAAEIYGRAASLLSRSLGAWRDAGLSSVEVSMGGGWAVPYKTGDPVLQPDEVAAAVQGAFGALEETRLAVEPGRALVARSAVAVYRVMSVKHRGKDQVVAIDGGIGDNPRPALYGARYTAFLAGHPLSEDGPRTDVVGRFCESGDVIARGLRLPETRRGELLCVPVSGAYQLTMASSYNLVPQPAVVLVDGPSARLITSRATVDDALAREIPLPI